MGDFNQLIQGPYGILICNKNDYIGQFIRDNGEWESHSVNLWKRFLSLGMTALDIGANIGCHTLALSKIVGDGGKVFAFEPQRLIYYMLAGVAAVNSLTNVYCYQKAVSNVEGSIFVPDLDMNQEYNFGGLTLDEPLYGNPKLIGGEHVQVVVIDNLGLEECHFIKIDVEGMEEKVLRGAEKTIRKFNPILYVENNRPGKSQTLVRFISSLGYKMFWDYDDNMLCLPKNFSVDLNLSEVQVD